MLGEQVVLAQQVERQPRLVGVQLDQLAGTGRELVDVDVARRW